jgi:hypothetical protein
LASLNKDKFNEGKLSEMKNNPIHLFLPTRSLSSPDGSEGILTGTLALPIAIGMVKKAFYKER